MKKYLLLAFVIMLLLISSGICFSFSRIIVMEGGSFPLTNDYGINVFEVPDILLGLKSKRKPKLIYGIRIGSFIGSDYDLTTNLMNQLDITRYVPLESEEIVFSNYILFDIGYSLLKDKKHFSCSELFVDIGISHISFHSYKTDISYNNDLPLIQIGYRFRFKGSFFPYLDISYRYLVIDAIEETKNLDLSGIYFKIGIVFAD